ncbi:hypothetical protein LCGC14_3004760, partial [marine sediment metagenome]
MKKFEKATDKKAVYKDKVTGQFEYWDYWQTHEKPASKPKGRPKGKGRFKQLTQDEVKELYARENKIKGGIKNVKVNTNKFKLFAAKMLAEKKT